MKEVGENAHTAADMLGYCAFGRGQPKRAERVVRCVIGDVRVAA